MDKCELLVALEEAKAKGSLLEISEEFLLNLVHSALSFDDNSLDIEEVKNVLAGQYVGVNSDKVRRITNQKNAFLKIVEMAKEKEALTEDALKDLHQILMEGFNIPGGLYRNVDISVKGSNHTPCDYIKVYDRMKKYYDTLAFYEGTDIQKAAYAHLQIAKVHPFLDGNGRLARLVMNYMLIKAGYLPINVPRRDMQVYFNLLEEFKVNKTQVPFEEFIEVRLNREYDRLIAIIDRYKDKAGK